MSEPLVRLDRVSKLFGGGPFRTGRQLRAVSDVSLTIERGESLGVVGESGSGKSTLGRLLLGLLPVSGGSVTFDGLELSGLRSGAMRRLRKRMQPIFQDPYASLDPLRRIGDQIADPIRLHGAPAGADIDELVGDLLVHVGLERSHARRYPSAFSGGQRQRIAIARALCSRPDLLVADEAVSALDATVQAQILKLLSDLRNSMGMTMVFISHDLSVVRSICDRVVVMYLGRVVEEAPAAELFDAPRHPYTQALMAAVPRLGARSAPAAPLGGDLPSPLAPPSGCGFRTRCPHAQPVCAQSIPALEETGTRRRVACIRWRELSPANP